MMRVSTKGRYALRMMIDLARRGKETPVALKDIAGEQKIPNKYTENIMAMLLQAGLVRSTRGKAGGYSLVRPASKYRIYDIIAAAEGEFSSVQCLEKDAESCPLQERCVTRPIWQGLDRVVRDYLNGITLAQLADSAGETTSCDRDDTER